MRANVDTIIVFLSFNKDFHTSKNGQHLGLENRGYCHMNALFMIYPGESR